MKKAFYLLMLLLVATTGWAEDKTWSFKWDTSKANGGEGFYHIANNEETTQVTTLNGLEWTYSGNTSVTAFSGSTGQYFGSAKSPVTHATLSTQYLKGTIKSVTIEAKKKSETSPVTIQVNIGDAAYNYDGASSCSLANDQATYTFTPNGEVAEGTICITMDQELEDAGIIYFLSMSIVYEGEGVTQPEIEQKDPQLSYGMQEMTVEAGDDAFANPLTNPFNVSPITYKAADESIAVIGNNGNVFTTGKVGNTLVTATFAGNEQYLPGEASYTLKVIPKPVIAAPKVNIPGGHYTEAQTITISSNDPLCKAIWYSTTAKDSTELVDNPTIVAASKAVITLDKNCTLRACAVDYNNIGCVLSETYTFDIPLKADFGAEESKKTYYQMGWDSVEEASTWKYYGISNRTWTLTEAPTLQGTKPFTVFDPNSKYSLSILYTSSQQRERAVSPEIEVRPNSEVEFYACFSGIWLVFADWKFYVNDLTTGTKDMLLSGFKWAQDNEFTGPNWIRFAFDLQKYAGHTCQFEFIYEGADGDDMSIDGFKLTQQDKNATSITIAQGETIHFVDLSEGDPDSWEWTLTGADEETSTEQNPVVTYSKAGQYDVTLTVKKGSESRSETKTAFINVIAKAPKAHIGMPECAYLSPWALAFVPTGEPITFLDESTGMPDKWAWSFEGTDIATSDEQNPTVTYTEEGQYGLELVVSNQAGTDRDFVVKAIKAGGACDVWNITPEETMDLGEIQMGYYGSYAGSNWLGMKSFAEHFHVPMIEASVDTVTVYFANTIAKNQNAEISVSLCLPDTDGMPGEALATTSLRASELQYDPKEVVPTYFVFDSPVTVTTNFFVVISGFPNTGDNDDVSVLCVRRNTGEKCTVFHLLEDEDANYNPLGTYTWYAQEDEALSMALTAHLRYGSTETGIDSLNERDLYHNGEGNYNTNETRRTIKIIDNGHIIIQHDGQRYNASGTRVIR